MSTKATPKRTKKASPTKGTAGKPRLLSGGNPQIPKGDGQAPVDAYIRAMPGWKRDVGRRLDKLISQTLPTVEKAVRWNSPFYEMPDQGWFLAFHCFTKYVKITFLKGSQLRPKPPVGSKDPDARYLHILEDQVLDEDQFVQWLRQASTIPGWKP